MDVDEPRPEIDGQVEKNSSEVDFLQKKLYLTHKYTPLDNDVLMAFDYSSESKDIQDPEEPHASVNRTGNHSSD